MSEFDLMVISLNRALGIQGKLKQIGTVNIYSEKIIMTVKEDSDYLLHCCMSVFK